MAPLQQAIIPTACLAFWQVMFVCKHWKLQPLVRDHLTFDLIFISGASREIKESALPLFFRPNWRPKKNFLRPPPLPPLSQGLDVQDPLTAVSALNRSRLPCLKSFAALLRKYDKFLVTTQNLAHSNLQIACSIFFNKDVSGLIIEDFLVSKASMAPLNLPFWNVTCGRFDSSRKTVT